MNDKTDIKTVQFKAGKRTYFLDVKQTADESKYLKITESKTGTDNSHERHSILIFEEDMQKFVVAMREVLKEFDWKQEQTKG